MSVRMDNFIVKSNITSSINCKILNPFPEGVATDQTTPSVPSVPVYHSVPSVPVYHSVPSVPSVHIPSVVAGHQFLQLSCIGQDTGIFPNTVNVIHLGFCLKTDHFSANLVFTKLLLQDFLLAFSNFFAMSSSSFFRKPYNVLLYTEQRESSPSGFPII